MRGEMRTVRALACALVGVMVGACSAADDSSGPRGGGSGGLSVGAANVGGAGAFGPGPQAGGMQGSGANGGGVSVLPGGCAAAGSEAQARLLPTDIVWAIDTSGSMTASFPAIQTALTDFSARVAAAGIDARIILLAGAQGLCVPQPLGSGQCGAAAGEGQPAPDSREPELLHLDLPFGSSEGVSTLLDNHAGYRHLLRPDALTHLVLTEDGAPFQTPAQVTDHVEGRAGAGGGAPWTPPLAPGSWVVHGVVCHDINRSGACLISFAPVPQNTLDLITMTGGQLGNLDDAGKAGAPDPFAQLLDKLAEQVIVGARVSCDYAIPPPPSGESLDTEAVNVALVDTAGTTIFPRAPNKDACAAHASWHYDDPDAPTQVVLCPAACEAAQSDPNARVDVQFGCDTLLQ